MQAGLGNVGSLPSIAEETGSSPPGSQHLPSSSSSLWGGVAAVRGFWHRITGVPQEETHGLLVGTPGSVNVDINHGLEGSTSGSQNVKLGVVAAFVVVCGILVGVSLIDRQASVATGARHRRHGSEPPRVQIGSPTTPNNHFHVDGCPALDAAPQGQMHLQVLNNCDETIWPGISPPGATPPPPGGWAWEAKECKTLTVSSNLPSLRIWGRTHCDDQYKCITGSCIVDGGGGCQSAGEAPCSLWEATFQDHCTATPVGAVSPDFSCQSPVVEPFDFTTCPFELRVYGDQIAGTTLPVEGILGVNRVVSPCFTTPLNKHCQQTVVGCRSLCKSMDQGWIGYYIDNVEGDRSILDPVVDRPGGQGKIRWSEQFLQGRSKCGSSLCKDVPAWGAFRGSAYSGGGTMKNLVCCDFGFRCSPYQPNNVPGGCPYDQACPTLGAADPQSRYHSKAGQDRTYPQADEEVRKSSSLPDWPLASNGRNYASVYKDASPSAYSWQFNDASSTFVCCGEEGKPSPAYVVTFCPGNDESGTSRTSSKKANSSGHRQP